MGMISRTEPDDCIQVDASASLQLKLQQIGWLMFVKKFHGHNLEMSRQFASTFDGRKAVIGDFELIIDQQALAEATGLPNAGEQWFKGKYDKENFHWNHFFSRNSPKEFGKGLPVGLLKKRYYEFMLVIMNYITCEGAYSLLQPYHVRLLMIFEGHTLNLPYYLLKSLKKMSRAYQRTSSPRSLFHHGLICILLKHQLVKHHISWNKFLSKIQLSDETHIRNYSLPCDLQVNEQPQVSDQLPESKRTARLISRLARNQVKKQSTPELVELDKEEIPTFSAARALIDLNQPPLRSPSPIEAIMTKFEFEPEDKECKNVVCHHCSEYKSQIQSLKDDISELHKQILKLKRQKRLMSDNYELEISDLNKKFKNTVSEHKINTSSINIVFNSEGQSSKSALL